MRDGTAIFDWKGASFLVRTGGAHIVSEGFNETDTGLSRCVYQRRKELDLINWFNGLFKAGLLVLLGLFIDT